MNLELVLSMLHLLKVDELGKDHIAFLDLSYSAHKNQPNKQRNMLIQKFEPNDNLFVVNMLPFPFILKLLL